MDKIIEILLDPQQFDAVMQNIASYVIYIYPGIISIYLYNFFIARKTKGTQAFIVKSFAISYIYNLLLQEVFPKMCFLKEKPEKNSFVYNVFLIFVAVFVPYFGYRFKKSSIFYSICEYIKISTSTTDIPFELLEDQEEKYTCLKIYIKDEPCVYIGYIEEYEYESDC